MERALSLALAGECGDDLLRELSVVEVAPAPSASHLLVKVNMPAHVPVANALARLEQNAPRLQVLVAQSITRKRAPELTFVPWHAGEVMP